MTDIKKQYGLFDTDAPFVAGSQTSEQAAKQIEPDARTLRGIVLAFIRGRGVAGATDEEIQMELQMNPSTERPRRIELVEAHLVEDSARRRPTNSGRQAVVWIAKKTG